MLTKSISLKNFYKKNNSLKIKKDFKFLLEKNLEVINSLKNNYKNNYFKKKIIKYKKFSSIRIIGMGGSILGAEAIYDFLKDKVKRKFVFVNNFKSKFSYQKN